MTNFSIHYLREAFFKLIKLIKLITQTVFVFLTFRILFNQQIADLLFYLSFLPLKFGVLSYPLVYSDQYFSLK